MNAEELRQRISEVSSWGERVKLIDEAMARERARALEEAAQAFQTGGWAYVLSVLSDAQAVTNWLRVRGINESPDPTCPAVSPVGYGELRCLLPPEHKGQLHWHSNGNAGSDCWWEGETP